TDSPRRSRVVRRDPGGCGAELPCDPPRFRCELALHWTRQPWRESIDAMGLGGAQTIPAGHIGRSTLGRFHRHLLGTTCSLGAEEEASDHWMAKRADPRSGRVAVLPCGTGG